MDANTVNTLSVSQLAAEIERLNARYRAGSPEVSDEVYDAVYVARLAQLDPTHELLGRVEPEALGVLGAPVRHSAGMLSTEKAYTGAEVASWVKRVCVAAANLGIAVDGVVIRMTPKLDGLAANWDHGVLATRGDGVFGQDITRTIARGLIVDPGAEGPGEVCVVQSYFESDIRDQYEMSHPRNFMVGLVGADELKAHHRGPLAAGMCRFVPYQSVASVEIPIGEVEARWVDEMAKIRAASEYLTDGAVIEVVDQRLRDELGATSHHHRWMLALKTQGDVAQTVVLGVTLQTGRTGRCTPVLEVEEVELSGAKIRRCTAHTARHVERLGLGPGAKVTLLRSGEVIPKLISVEAPSAVPVDMSKCPSCGHATEWDNDYLVCLNQRGCPAQATARLEHFFLRLGVNGFGPKVCESIAEKASLPASQICSFKMPELVACGISPGVARNLVEAIEQRKNEIVRDSDVLAAFGIRHLGRGDSRKLLEVYPWQKIKDLSAVDIAGISGFGERTATLIQPYLSDVQSEIEALVTQGFKIEATVRASEVKDTPIKGKKVVFTGAMPLTREHMEQLAREMGATVQSSVSSTTDLLIAGEKAGSKVAKAEKLGVKIMQVSEYMDLVHVEETI